MLEGGHLEIRVTNIREAKNTDVEEFARELLVLVDCGGEARHRCARARDYVRQLLNWDTRASQHVSVIVEELCEPRSDLERRFIRYFRRTFGVQMAHLLNNALSGRVIQPEPGFRVLVQMARPIDLPVRCLEHGTL